MNATHSTDVESIGTTDLPGTETETLSTIVDDELHFDQTPDFDVWMTVGWETQRTIERTVEEL